jgi:hypothetical protein
MTIKDFFVAVKGTPNVEFRVWDKDGNAKLLFNDNKLAKVLIQSNVLSPLWINSKYAPYLAPFLGSYRTVKLGRNKIVNAGLALAAGLLNGSGSPTTPTYIAVGTGVVAVSATDTALGTETATSGLSRAVGTVSLVTTTVTNDTAQWLKSFSVSGTVSVTESGVFNAASVGTMLCRQTFTAIGVVNGDTLQITWKVAETSAN